MSKPDLGTQFDVPVLRVYLNLNAWIGYMSALGISDPTIAIDYVRKAITPIIARHDGELRLSWAHIDDPRKVLFAEMIVARPEGDVSVVSNSWKEMYGVDHDGVLDQVKDVVLCCLHSLRDRADKEENV